MKKVMVETKQLSEVEVAIVVHALDKYASVAERASKVGPEKVQLFYREERQRILDLAHLFA